MQFLYVLLCSFLLLIGDLEEACCIFENAIQFANNKFGPEHVETITTSLGLAKCYVRLKNFVDAKRILKTAKKIYESAFGEDSVQLLQVKKIKVNLAYEEGETNTAEELARFLIAQYKVVLSETHPDTIDMKHELGRILEQKASREHFNKKSYYEEALECYMFAANFSIEGNYTWTSFCSSDLSVCLSVCLYTL